jgi:hypothetical protein
MKYFEVQLIWPPVLDRRASAGRGFVSSAGYRTLAVFIHLRSPFLIIFFEHPLDLSNCYSVYKHFGNFPDSAFLIAAVSSSLGLCITQRVGIPGAL